MLKTTNQIDTKQAGVKMNTNTKNNKLIESAEYNEDLDGYVITLQSGAVVHFQYDIETNRLHADYGERFLGFYDKEELEALTLEEQEAVCQALNDAVDPEEKKGA